MRCFSPLAVFLLAAWLAPAVARADVSDADRAQARVLAVEGQEALNRKDYTIALDRFRRADALIHAPTLLIGVARAQAGLGQLLAAQESYSRILREGVAEGAPEPFFVALDAARVELEKLTPRVPSVTIRVQGAAAPEVTLDGERLPLAALGVRRPVDPGTRVIRASAPGLAPIERKIAVAEGTHETTTLQLEPASAPAPAPAPAPTRPAPDAGEGLSRTTLGIVTLGVGGAGLALGAVTGILAIGKHGELQDACPTGSCQEAQRGDLDSYHTLGTLSTLGFIAGGAGAAAGALLILTAPDATPSEETSIRPILAPGYVGARGRF